MNANPKNRIPPTVIEACRRARYTLAINRQPINITIMFQSVAIILFCLLLAPIVDDAFFNRPLLMHALLFSSAISATAALILTFDHVKSPDRHPPSYLLAFLIPITMLGIGTFFIVVQPTDAYSLNEKITKILGYFAISTAALHAALTIPVIPLARRLHFKRAASSND